MYFYKVRGETIAFMHAESIDDGCVEIFQIMVNDEYKRRGIGRSLVDHLWANVYPTETIIVESHPSIESTTFWERLGFVPTGKENRGSVEYIFVR